MPMHQGKAKCETLKVIRKKIADANEIPYEPVKCTHEGDCRGTCPACESEVRYIENQLNIRKMAGKAVKVVGLASAMTLAACNSVDNSKQLENKQIETEDVGKGELIEKDSVVPIEEDSIPQEFPEISQEYLDSLFIADAKQWAKQHPIATMGMISRNESTSTSCKTSSDTNQKDSNKKDTADGRKDTIASTLVEDSDDDVLMGAVVMHKADFPGGMNALVEFLKENLVYPDSARKAGIQGRVIVSFVVEKDGSISDAEVVRGVDPALDAEAIRVVCAMPNWKPAMERGEAVRSRFQWPVLFRITEPE